MDLNDTYIYYWYLWNVEVDPRSRSQGQRSRSYRHLCEKIVWAITHERMDGSSWNFLWWSVMLKVKALHQIDCVVTRPLAATTLVRIKCFLHINHEQMDGSYWYLSLLCGVREITTYSGSMANEVICFPYLGFVQRFSRVRVTEEMVMSVWPRWAEIDQDRQR